MICRGREGWWFYPILNGCSVRGPPSIAQDCDCSLCARSGLTGTRIRARPAEPSKSHSILAWHGSDSCLRTFYLNSGIWACICSLTALLTPSAPTIREKAMVSSGRGFRGETPPSASSEGVKVHVLLSKSTPKYKEHGISKYHCHHHLRPNSCTNSILDKLQISREALVKPSNPLKRTLQLPAKHKLHSELFFGRLDQFPAPMMKV